MEPMGVALKDNHDQVVNHNLPFTRLSPNILKL